MSATTPAPPVLSTDIEPSIEDMTCASCANRIERTINRLDGVTATVNYATEKARDSATAGIDPAVLIARVEAAGYRATLPSAPAALRAPAVVDEEPDDPSAALRQRLITSALLSVPVAPSTKSSTISSTTSGGSGRARPRAPCHPRRMSALEDGARPRRRGRPRDHGRTGIILEATIAIVTAVGLDRLRVQDVAERAGVSLATIYRRWPTRTALVTEAIRRDPGPLEDLPDGDAPPDVETVLRAIAIRLRDTARMAVLAVEVDEPEILAAVRETHLPPVRRLMRQALEDVPGLAATDMDLLVDVGPALVWYRSLIAGDDDDPTELARRIRALLTS